ncbi:MAG: hypothetical protein ACI4XC_07570 [Eubacterium sp.]
MALGALFILEIVILFSFIITSIFMFVPKKEEAVHKIFFALSVMLGVLVTVINATSLPSNYTTQIIIAWMGLIPAAIGVIIAVAKGKPTVPSKILAILTTIIGAFGYLFLM